jgi:hypothetical protein
MSEGEKKFVERTLTANSNRFKPAPEPQKKKGREQSKIGRDREKDEVNRQERMKQSAPYPPTRPSLLSTAREAALEATRQLGEKSAFNKEYPISDYKETLNITPSKPVPEGINPFTPSELDRSIIIEKFKQSQPSALKFEDDFDDMGFDLDEKIEEKGGRKRRKSKSRKLRKSPKKSRKSKRKTTRKNRRHRRR